MSAKIPIVVLTKGAIVAPLKGDVAITLEPPLHNHRPGDECPACAAIGDIRVALYELLDAQRAGTHKPILRVIVDASMIDDVIPTVARLNGTAPATAMRDHVVARAFELTEVR